jgi:hypothetical protein
LADLCGKRRATCASAPDPAIVEKRPDGLFAGGTDRHAVRRLVIRLEGQALPQQDGFRVRIRLPQRDPALLGDARQPSAAIIAGKPCFSSTSRLRVSVVRSITVSSAKRLAATGSPEWRAAINFAFVG